MDHMYQVLGPDRYRLHYMLHGGKVTQCGGFTGEQLKQAIDLAGSPSVNVCTMCAVDEAHEVLKQNGQSR